jgi:hypothetical protein
MSDEERRQVEEMQDRWNEYNESPQSDQVLGLTQQAEFMKYFVDPTLP